MILRDDEDALPGGQTTGALRSRILLGVLADADAERLELRATREELDAKMAWFRGQFDMPRRADVEDFLAFAALDVTALTTQMRTYVHIQAAERHHQAEIERRMPSYEALLRLEHWRGR